MMIIILSLLIELLKWKWAKWSKYRDIKKAWNHIIETNEMLRTIYKWDKLDKPVQIVLRNYDIPFKFFDLSKESNEIKDELFKEILENHKNENINISNEGKYILMGYSAGGNLAFEVAKELENSGYEVEHIILMKRF